MSISRFLGKVKDFIVTVPRILFLEDIRDIWDVKNAIVSGVVILGSAVLNVVAPAALSKGVEMMAKEQEHDEFLGISCSPVGLFTTSAFLYFWAYIETNIRKQLMLSTENALVEELSEHLSDTAQTMPMEVHDRLKHEMIGMHFSAQHTCGQLPHELSNLFASMTGVFFGTAGAWYRFGHAAGLELLAYALVNMFAYNGLISSLTNVREESDHLSKKVNNLLEHEYKTLSSARTVRVYNRSAYELEVSKKKFKKVMQARQSAQSAEFLYDLLGRVPQLIATLFLIGRIYGLSQQQEEGMEEAIFLLTYINIFGLSVANVDKNLVKVSSILADIDKIKQLQGDESKEDEWIPTAEFPAAAPTVEMRNVTLKVGSAVLLKNISFFAKPGITAIVGNTGAGKSSLLDTLAGFHQPIQGSIKINDRDYPAAILTKIVAYVTQDTEINQKTIRKNVLYGDATKDLFFQKGASRPEANYRTFDQEEGEVKVDQMAEKIMTKVGLAELIPNCDDEVRLKNLSGGEKQRLSIARSDAKTVHILLLDEPTAAQDPCTKAKVLKAIAEGAKDKTTIIVTHDLETASMADLILYMKNGELVDQGAHEELLKKNKDYVELWGMKPSESYSPLRNF